MAERTGLDGRDESEWIGMLKKATKVQLFKMIEDCRHEINSMHLVKE